MNMGRVLYGISSMFIESILWCLVLLCSVRSSKAVNVTNTLRMLINRYLL